MHYAYESGGRVSRPISDYRSEVLSGSFAARDLNSFWFTQGPAIQLQDIDGERSVKPIMRHSFGS